MEGPQGLAEEETTNEDAQERVDKVSETAIDDATMIRRPDKGAPVDREEQAGGGVRDEVRAAFHLPDPRPQFSSAREQGQDREHRPDDTMGESEVRAEMAQLLPKDRQSAPERKGDNGP